MTENSQRSMKEMMPASTIKESVVTKSNTIVEFGPTVESILRELTHVLTTISPAEVQALLNEVLSANTIVAAGAGRVGLAVRGFAMRLAHLGMPTHMLGDATVPAITSGDLLLVASGSGETQTIFDIVALAHQNGARVALVTGNPASHQSSP
jgi:6-phospho-3-hexuloisomerase